MNRAAILAAAAALTLTSAGAASATTRIVANCFFPPQSFNCQKILKGWGEEVERVTEGRVKVNMPAKSMAPPSDQLASIRGGVFDAALQFDGFIQSEAPGLGISLLPFVNGNDARANSIAFWRAYTQFIAPKEPLKGVKVLGVIAAPGVDFYSLNSTPIESVEDIRNRKMWALPGTPADLVKQVGSAAVSGPAVQMTEIVQRGVVDGFVGVPDDGVKTYNLMPYVKSATQTKSKVFAPGFTLLIGEAKWSEIEPADQEAILSVSGEAFSEMAGREWSEVEAASEQELAASAKVIQASDSFESELSALASPYQERWVEAMKAKGIDGQAALDLYRKTVAELGAR